LFYVRYIVSELRRRKGRTFLTALGLGVGVGLVITVAALSSGLDDAQDEVLEPLTGVGTDISVSRPIEIDDGKSAAGESSSPFGNLSEQEQKRLRDENRGAQFDLNALGEPGDKFTTTNFVSATQLSFPESQTEAVADLNGTKDVAASLTLNAVQLSGTVPEESGGTPFGPPSAAGSARGAEGENNIDFTSTTVTGVDQSEKSLGAITSEQVTQGSYFSQGSSREAILNVSYANRNNIGMGDKIKLKGKELEVVGLASPPLGGQASDIYMKIDQLQKLSGKEGRANTLYVRADGSHAVAGLTKDIERSLEGSEVTTSQELADRVSGSLVDAKNLSDKLGTALTIVALVAAFMIASLLTLSSVTKRTRELGTLKALGWPQRKVVRQVTGESLAQGALGGKMGALLGIAGAGLITAQAPELEATVAQGGQSGAPGFGQGAIEAGSQLVQLEAPVDPQLILVAIGLALVGGLIAGAAGAARASRLRPADALRHID
jgi:putative ABC transport system permease protein